jgi:ammonium transporter, Amt family
MRLGILATTAFNPAGTDGLLHGNMHFFLVQCAAILLASIWAFAFTLGMLWVVNRITPVRVSEETEQMGLDQGLGGDCVPLKQDL